jgi:hypothetical protein
MYELIERPDRKPGMISVTGEIPASCPLGVIRVVLAVDRLLPVYPDEQTFSVSEGMSQTGPITDSCTGNKKHLHSIISSATRRRGGTLERRATRRELGCDSFDQTNFYLGCLIWWSPVVQEPQASGPR